MKSHKTNELQIKLLEIMQNFHDICQDHNLRYYMLRGTMLGAVRHKGFIPWDDDIDVGMPRGDYKKLLSLPESVWPEPLELVSPRESENLFIQFSKVMNIDTTLIEEGPNGPIVGGVFLDIFPLDGAGNSKQTAKLSYQIYSFKRGLVAYNIYQEKKDGFIKANLQKYIRMLNTEKIYSNMEKWMSRISFEKSNIIGNYSGAWGLKEFVMKSVMGEPVLYEFEDSKFYGVNNADKYLTSLYGDYMKLPPLENRHSHHSFIHLDLKKGFIDLK